MDVSENGLELLQILYEEKVTVSVVEKRTKWMKSSFDKTKQELLREGLVTGEGEITLAGKKKVERMEKEQKFNVDINAFNTKWG